MRHINSMASVPSPADGAAVCPEDFLAARKYLRYYQRGFVAFAIIVALGVLAEQLLPAGVVPGDVYHWDQAVVAAAAILYVVAPYWRKAATLYRKQIRPLFALLPERR